MPSRIPTVTDNDTDTGLMVYTDIDTDIDTELINSTDTDTGLYCTHAISELCHSIT